MMRRGYSRDHRPDCEQMVIALIVNSEGFPFSYETFDGNRTDVSTMETILRMVERKYGKARRIWVIGPRDHERVENLAAIRKRGGQYLVGAPRSQMKQFEKELLKDDWTEVRPEVEVKQISIPQGEETYILCRTAGPEGKREGDPKSIFAAYGRRSQSPGEDDCRGPAEGPQQDGAAAGTDTGESFAGELSVRGIAQRYGRRCAAELEVEGGSQGLAGAARRGVHAAQQSQGGHGGGAVVAVHAIDGSGGIVPGR